MSEDGGDGATPGAGGRGDHTDPLANLDVDLDAGDVPDDPFEEVDVDEVDEDAVWDRLADDDEELEVLAGEVIVPKRKYCERCEYFTDPPEVACEHPGTEIHQLVDVNRFRVENCPVVAERRRMGAEPEGE